MSAATIRADLLELALVAQRHQLGSSPRNRWCVMSTGYATSSCSSRLGQPYRLHQPSLLLPLHNHGLKAVAERTRLLHGRDEVRRIFDRGIASIRSDRDFWRVPAGGAA